MIKHSVYNFYKAHDGVVLVYNSASGNCIVISEAELHSFMEISLPEDEQARLRRMGFFVDNCTDEMLGLIDNAYASLSRSKKDKYRILTTTRCNASCEYCYEKGVAPNSMTRDTADKVVEFILNRSMDKQIVEVEWFGGEPLLNADIIAYFTKNFCLLKPSSMRYEASIITNGFLLNRNVIEEMADSLLVKRVQITLDGTKAAYEKIKGLGTGSFEKIIDNLRILSEYNLEIDLRLNFDESNIDDMENLIEYLAGLDFHRKPYVYPAKINNEERSENFALEQESIRMYNALHRHGLMTGIALLPKTMKNPCAAAKRNYFTIGADGQLFKCDRKLLSGNSLGTVNCSAVKPTGGWEAISPEAKCKPCKMFPLCWGGCIYERMKKLDRCYITEKIIYNNLGLVLEDVIKAGVV